MVTAQFMKTGRKKHPKTITHVEVTQTSLWSRLTNSRLLAFLYGALFLSCDQSNRWNVTGNNRNISIYSRSRVNRLKQLFGLQLSVCTNVTGRFGGGMQNPPRLRLVELAQASWELCATKRRTRLCLVPGERSGCVWTASVTGLLLATGDAWCLRHSLKSAAEGGQTCLTSQVKWEQVPLTTVHFLSNRKKRFW